MLKLSECARICLAAPPSCRWVTPLRSVAAPRACLRATTVPRAHGAGAIAGADRRQYDSAYCRHVVERAAIARRDGLAAARRPPGFRIDQLDNTNGQSLYFDRWVAQLPDIITLHLGTNDCYQNYQPATLLTKMDTLLNHTFKALPRTFSWRPSWQRQTAGTGARRTGPQHHVCTGGGGLGAVCTGCVSGAWPLRVQERAPHRGRLPPSRLGVCLCSAAVL
jgi:hypothetical protein